MEKKDIIDTTIYLKHYDKIAHNWVIVNSFIRYEDCHIALRALKEKYPNERFAIMTQTTMFREV